MKEFRQVLPDHFGKQFLDEPMLKEVLQQLLAQLLIKLWKKSQYVSFLKEILQQFLMELMGQLLKKVQSILLVGLEKSVQDSEDTSTSTGIPAGTSRKISEKIFSRYLQKF